MHTNASVQCPEYVRGHISWPGWIFCSATEQRVGAEGCLQPHRTLWCVFSSPWLPARFAFLCTPCRSQRGQCREAPYTKAEGKACSISPHLHLGRALDKPNKLKYSCFVCPTQVWKLKDHCCFCSLSLHVCTCFYTSGDLAGRLQRMNSKLPKTQRSSPWTHNRNAVLQIGSFPCFWLLMTFWPITPSSHTF